MWIGVSVWCTAHSVYGADDDDWWQNKRNEQTIAPNNIGPKETIIAINQYSGHSLVECWYVWARCPHSTIYNVYAVFRYTILCRECGLVDEPKPLRNHKRTNERMRTRLWLQRKYVCMCIHTYLHSCAVDALFCCCMQKFKPQKYHVRCFICVRTYVRDDIYFTCRSESLREPNVATHFDSGPHIVPLAGQRNWQIKLNKKKKT